MSASHVGRDNRQQRLPRQVFLNGRFLRARPTGVQRVARELIHALDDHLASDNDPNLSWTLIRPRGAADPGYRHISAPVRGGLPGQAWEQLNLPPCSKSGLLINLCNTAPLIGGRMMVMIHDAQIYTTPESYSAKFVAWYKFLLPKIAQRAEKVLTVSDFSRDQLHHYGVAPREKIEVVPNGVDHFSRVAPDPQILGRFGLNNKRYVLAFSSAQRHKNTQILLRAFEFGKLDGLTLVLFGKTAKSELEKSGLIVPPETIFTGALSDGALRGLMANALCFACPSTTEGFGLPPLEAMAEGCPAVVAPCGALPEACGSAALYADPSDPTAWEAAFLGLADNDAHWLEYAKRGRVQASRFTWISAAQRLAQVVEQVA